ncbi:glycoside hydrolase family 5 protein [Clostridium sp. SHJSY1]|uniref:glycoside hydrolase family 5 protein n=1 Tax=Clostridium sp. SHJSY1 TaxID=2942483 RepID=UPI002874FED5|nr:cellulase family glycosylhydrolase [Clostridium sp. SHJSY1]MDS0527237.1 glycoside hydrolase family 5 protein [Clostridium sp. SHJSY1]
MNKKVKSLILGVTLAVTTILISNPQISHATEDSSWIRGVNVPAAWYDSQSYSSLDKIKSETFNSVRIVWETKGSTSRLDEYLTKCDKLNLKPIVELHDATGGMDTTSLKKCLDYWLRSDVMNVMKKHPSAWLNIANEWGPENSTVWRDGYKDSVSKLRSSGFGGTIVIDSGGWGQDSQDILKYAKDIYNVNSNKNVIFSIHMYGSWNDNSKIDSFLSSCKNKEIPIIIGEFGYNSNNGNNNLGCKVDVAHLISYCKANKIGFLAWSWTGNDSANAWLDMTSNWTNYTWWGKYVHDNMW